MSGACLSADASLTGTLVSRSTAEPDLGPDLAYLKLSAVKASDSIHIKITDPSSNRWEVPGELYPPDASAREPRFCCRDMTGLTALADSRSCTLSVRLCVHGR